MDALVFADDNPAECAEVAAALPEVDTVVLDVPSSELVRTVAGSLRFELSALTHEDVARQKSYGGRAAAESLRTAAASLEDFWRSLEMRARVRDVDDASLERAAQLTQKTNQFNLTLVRRTLDEVRNLAAQPGSICKTLELDDRFAQHGIVGLVLAIALRRRSRDAPARLAPAQLPRDRPHRGGRISSRTSHARRSNCGCTRLRGSYVEGPRNALVADLYPRLGFGAVPGLDGVWDYDLATNGPLQSDYIDDLP